MEDSPKTLSKWKTNKKELIRESYKKGNNTQQAIRQENLKKNFHYKQQKLKRKHEFLKERGLLKEKTLIGSDELQYLPAIARISLENDSPENEDHENNDHDNERHQCKQPASPKKKKLSQLGRARQQFRDIREEREKQQQEAQTRRQEKEEKQRLRKERTAYRNTKFSQKTKRGQPIMRARMDLLLERINSQHGKK